MAELKSEYAYTIDEIEVLCSCAEGDEFYRKSEADDAIAEKDEKIDELQKATDSAWSKVNTMYDELRHYKYRRCVAMTKWCESEDKRIEALAPLFDIDKECWEFVSDYWNRWHKRWLELAKKFELGN